MRFLLPNQGVRVIATLVLLLLLSAGALADTRIAALNIER